MKERVAKKLFTLLLIFTMMVSMSSPLIQLGFAEADPEVKTEAAASSEPAQTDVQTAAVTEDSAPAEEASAASGSAASSEEMSDAEEPAEGSEAADAEAAADEEAAEDKTSDKEAVKDGKKKEEPPKEEKKEDEEVKMPAASGVVAETGKVRMTFSWDEGVFPEGTEPSIRVLSHWRAMNIAKAGMNSDVADAFAVDITFSATVNGEKVSDLQPAKANGVHVSMQLKEALEGENFTVMHQDDGGNVSVVSANADESGAEFNASSFSIYVIGGETGEKRVQVVFKNGDATVATKIVREGNVLQAPDEPASLEPDKVFDHWETGSIFGKMDLTPYINNDGLTAEQMEALVQLGSKVEGETELYRVNASANFRDAYKVEFAQYAYKDSGDPNNAILAGTEWSTNDKNKGNVVDLSTISGMYVIPGGDGTTALTGWAEYADGADAGAEPTVIHPTNEVMELRASKKLYPVVSTGNWVNFDTLGAPRIGSVFVTNGTLAYADLEKPEDGFYQGYTFDGWYETYTADPDKSKYDDSCYSGEVTGDISISAEKTLYAKWKPAEVSYTVVNMLEGPEGGPGEGVYARGPVWSVKGLADSKPDVPIYGDSYKGNTIDDYHIPTADENPGGRSDDGYTLNQRIADIRIKNDDSTVIYVYWNRNRYKVQWGYHRDTFNPAPLTPSKYPMNDPKYGEYIKWGEETDLWDIDNAIAELPGEPAPTAHWYGYQLFRGGTDVEWGHEILKDETRFPLIHGAKDDATIVYKWYGHPYTKVIVIQYWYEVDSSYSEKEGVIEKTIGGKHYYFEKRFEELDHSQSGGNVTALNQLGLRDGFVQFAVSENSEDTYNVFTNPYATSSYRGRSYTKDGKQYIDYYWRAEKYKLAFGNVSDISNIPDPSKLEEQSVKNEEPLAAYDPGFDSSIVRNVNGQRAIFSGWYYDSVAAKDKDLEDREDYRVDFENDSMKASDITIYASWDALTCDVTFDANGGKFNDDSDKKQVEDIEDGSLLEQPEAPVRDGYTFAGWFSDKGLTKAWNFANNPVRKDMTLYAKWINNESYELIYHDAQHNPLADETRKYYSGAVIAVADKTIDTTSTGVSNFLGWSTEPKPEGATDETIGGNVEKLVGSKVTIDGVTKLYATYGDHIPTSDPEETEEDAPKVTIDGEDAGPGGQDIVYPEITPKRDNDEIVLPTQEDIKKENPGLNDEGYTLTGWEDEDGNVIPPGTPVGVDSDTELTPVYKMNVAITSVVGSDKTGTVSFDASTGAVETQTNNGYAVTYKIGTEESTSLPEGFTCTVTAKQDGEDKAEDDEGFAVSGAHAGTYAATVTATLSGESDDYVLVENQKSGTAQVRLILSKAEISATVTGGEKTYGEDDPDELGTIAYKVGETAVSCLAPTLSRAEGEDVGKYATTLTTEAPTGEGKVTLDDLTVTDNTDKDVSKFTIKKASQTAPAAPELEAESDGIGTGTATVSVKDPADDQEYSIDGGTTWVKPTGGKVEFADCEPNKEYSVIARKAGDKNHEPSAPSDPAKITTPKEDQEAPDEPTAKADDPTTVTVENPAEANEYIIVPKGTDPKAYDWDDAVSPEGGKVTFEELDPDTEYEVVARKKGDDTHNPSPAVKTTVKTPKAEYSVSFDTNGGSAVEPQTIKYGEKAAEPEKAPAKKGSDFSGWYADKQLTKAFDFSTPIKKDVTVYAKWTEFNYYISDGADQTWTKGSTNNVTITSKRTVDDGTTFERFTDLYIDGVALEKGKDYTVAEGSVIATINASTLEKMAPGKKTVKFAFEDGETSTSLTITESTVPAKDKDSDTSGKSKASKGVSTGDSNIITLYLITFVMAVAGCIVLAVRRKSREK